jgi:hypothetical protein
MDSITQGKCQDRTLHGKSMRESVCGIPEPRRRNCDQIDSPLQKLMYISELAIIDGQDRGQTSDQIADGGCFFFAL